MIISVQLITNAERKTVTANDSDTVRAVLDNNNIRYENTPVYLDGAPLSAGDYAKSFADLGVSDKCKLTSVIKTENA